MLPCSGGQHNKGPHQQRRIIPASKKTVLIDMDRLRELGRCCICFENYSMNVRVPLCFPCGHSFCRVCARNLTHGNLVCCCICRKIALFGPTELGKNIELLKVLEPLGLLDADAAIPPQSSTTVEFSENVIQGVQEQDIIKFIKHCFDFIKVYYEKKQEKLVSTHALHNIDRHEYSQRLNRARSRLNNSMEEFIQRINQCNTLMDASEIPQYFPIFVEFDDNRDPFDVDTART